MLSTTFQYFKMFICLVLFCTWAQVGLGQPTSFVDNDEDQANLEKAWINNFPALLNTHLNGQLPLEDYFYHQKPSNADHSALGKRLIMLPRVGRRSVRSTSS